MKKDYQKLWLILIIPILTIFLFTSITAYAESRQVIFSNGSGIPGCETTNSCYSPFAVSVGLGETITWINEDTFAHTATSGVSGYFGEAEPWGFDGTFDTGILMTGDSFSHTFDTEGTFNYFCMLHPWMTGIVLVDENYSSTPKYVDIQLFLDKESYTEGDTIQVFGTVSNNIGIDMNLIVTRPGGKIIEIQQFAIKSDKTFETQIVIGKQYDVDGVYSVEVRYGLENMDLVAFEFRQLIQDTIPPTISVWSDKSSYKEGDFIKISGKVTNPTSASLVSMILKAPNGNLVSISQHDLNYDHTFSTTTIAGGALMATFGTYLFEVAYGSASDSGSFYFSVPEIPTYPPPTYDTTPPKILKPTNITVDAENSNGVRVTFEVIAIDDTDQIVKPTCNPSSGAMFSVGTTAVTCNARDSAGNRAPSVSFSVTVIPLKVAIPDWIKTIASVWCDDKIADSEFISAIQYLIDNHIITVSETSSGYGSSQEIPNWIKNNACWWSEDLITNDDFTSGLEYLIKLGIIIV